VSAWSARRCDHCNGRGTIDPFHWPISRKDRRDAATFLAIEASSLENLAAMNVEGTIANAIGASESARLVAIAAVYAAKVSDDYEDDGGRDDEYMVDVYAEAASMIETGWPKNRAEMERALAEAFEHGEIVIDGGVARVAR
jgi:elongation factor P hydroxylase